MTEHGYPYREIFDTFRLLWRHGVAKPHDIRDFQARKLRVLINHAYRKVPYYRRMFEKCGVHPVDIRQVDDLTLLPISSSQHFRVQPTAELLAEGIDADQLVVHHTSGSSGRRLILLCESSTKSTSSPAVNFESAGPW